MRETLPEAAKQEFAAAMQSGAADRLVFAGGLEVRAHSTAIKADATTTDARGRVAGGCGGGTRGAGNSRGRGEGR